jgi:hypothetical protein
MASSLDDLAAAAVAGYFGVRGLWVQMSVERQQRWRESAEAVICLEQSQRLQELFRMRRWVCLGCLRSFDVPGDFEVAHCLHCGVRNEGPRPVGSGFTPGGGLGRGLEGGKGLEEVEGPEGGV